MLSTHAEKGLCAFTQSIGIQIASILVLINEIDNDALGFGDIIRIRFSPNVN